MGLSDSIGRVIPAGLARAIVAHDQEDWDNALEQTGDEKLAGIRSARDENNVQAAKAAFQVYWD